MESMENICIPRQEEQKFELPSGFRFHPTDEELINYYLIKKVLGQRFSAIAIADVDLNKCEPWDLPGLAKMGETEWYFFCVRDKKYPTGQRTNRATDAGYWKATGKDKEIISMGNTRVGMKKTLVFYKGRAPRGEKTNWVMHEYRLEGNHSEYTLPQPERSEWVICRVFEKSHSGKRVHISKFGRLNSLEDEPLPTPASSLIPPLMDSSSSRTTPGELSQVTCFSEPNQAEDWNNTHDDIVDSRETPILNFSSASSIPPSDISPASWVFAKEAPAVSNHQSTQIAHQIGNSQCQPDYSVPQEPSMLRMMTENHGSSAGQNQKAESSQGRDFDVDISSLLYNNDMFYRFFGNQEHSSASAGPVDIGNLWNY